MHVSFRHPKRTQGKMLNWFLIEYRNIYTVANHVIYIQILKKFKEIDSSLFLWEMDEKRNTDRTDLAGSR